MDLENTISLPNDNGGGYEFLEFDRIQKIKNVISKYGIENFYISFSGGKDSVVLSNLVDLALPNNEIPRVYADTGIELNAIKDFVMSLKEKDNRIQIIKPAKNIKATLEEFGYPFKSKQHSSIVATYQNSGMCKTVERYVNPSEERKRFGCPQCLKYQFDENSGFDLKVSNKCCDKLKKEPIRKWQKENNKPYGIVGIMKDEGGARMNAHCLAFKGDKLHNFQPLVVVTKDWEDWFIAKHNIRLCKIYYEPYNFKRSGCKGCAFNIELQKDLDILEKYFPNEREQCEIIWKPVYDEYRRIGYRLKDNEDLRNRRRD